MTTDKLALLIDQHMRPPSISVVFEQKSEWWQNACHGAAEAARTHVLNELIAEAEANADLYGGGVDYLANNAMWTRVSRWLSRKVAA